MYVFTCFCLLPSQGQRFSTAGSRLSAAPTLEDPSEFVNYIAKNVPSVGGRAVVAQTLEGARDFTDLLKPLGLQIKGLAATHAEPDAVHLWRILPRWMLQSAGFQNDSVQRQLPEWAFIEDSDHGAILLTKTFMHSGKYSQTPTLLLPEAVAKKLSKEGFRG